ncbi:predicted protein [Postia placenta Mad-698-R]|nr:predicted protein [Postia placenta Mad-698-R]
MAVHPSASIIQDRYSQRLVDISSIYNNDAMVFGINSSGLRELVLKGDWLDVPDGPLQDGPFTEGSEDDDPHSDSSSDDSDTLDGSESAHGHRPEVENSSSNTPVTPFENDVDGSVEVTGEPQRGVQHRVQEMQEARNKENVAEEKLRKRYKGSFPVFCCGEQLSNKGPYTHHLKSRTHCDKTGEEHRTHVWVCVSWHTRYGRPDELRRHWDLPASAECSYCILEEHLAEYSGTEDLDRGSTGDKSGEKVKLKILGTSHPRNSERLVMEKPPKQQLVATIEEVSDQGF